MDEYTIVVDYDVDDLVTLVNKHMALGWVVVGPVVINTMEDTYMQTMTRTEENKTLGNLKS